MSSTARETADRLHSAAIHVLRRVAREDIRAGVTPARLSALSVLVFGGPQTISELAALERVKVPTMSRLVAAMEGEGLVRRVEHETDARAVVLHATARGRRILGRARELRLALLESLLAEASPGELRTVREAAEIVDRLVS
jgi:DNA-binding MarR family transcriptional regulator